MEVTWPLIEALFDVVPERLKHSPLLIDEAEAFAWCCYSFWQCESAFPAFPERYAAFLLDQLVGKKAPNSGASRLVVLLLAGASVVEEWPGINHPELRDPDVLRTHERVVRDGLYEVILDAPEKYDEFERLVRTSVELRNEWSEIKQTFPEEVGARPIIHRSLIPERNWVRGLGADFDNDETAFQAVFDLFCWKYFLWAMKGDEPLLMKPSVVFTPFGTQIFIPGYISFDPKRDLKLGLVSKLHRARGVRRQGKGFSIGRIDRYDRAMRAAVLDAGARGKGLKGDRRLQFVADGLRIRTRGDYREISRLIAEGKRRHKG